MERAARDFHRNVANLTGLSRAQVSRLVARQRIGGELRDRRGRPARPFPGQLCKPAWEVFGDARGERLDRISNGHLDNLRGSQTYQRCRGRAGKDRAVQVRMGERRHPQRHRPAGGLAVRRSHGRR